jgi:hypothetical protein
MSERVYLSRGHHAYFAVEHGSGRIGAARRSLEHDRFPVLDQPATTSGAPSADDEEQLPSTPSRFQGSATVPQPRLPLRRELFR